MTPYTRRNIPGVTQPGKRWKVDEGPPWPSFQYMYEISGWNRMDDPHRVKLLKGIVESYGRDPRLRDFVINKILRPAGVLAQNRQYRAQAECLLKWVQNNIAYMNEPGELIQSPWHSLKVKHGDCDDMTVLLCSFAESIKLPWKIVLAGKVRGPGGQTKSIRWIEGTPLPRGASFYHIYCLLGWPPFKPTEWAPAEPTLRGVPLGYDVTVHGVPKRRGGPASGASGRSHTSALPELSGWGDGVMGMSGDGVMGMPGGTMQMEPPGSDGIQRAKRPSLAITAEGKPAVPVVVKDEPKTLMDEAEEIVRDIAKFALIGLISGIVIDAFRGK